MMATHHPQRWMRPPGAQRCYWIVSSRHGRLGGIAFCAASWHQKARDEFVGWSADARVANLQRMVNNNRFLLLPGVRVRGLASHVLDLAATRLPGDWEAAYGVRPAYTYVSPDHSGACYRAAGWERCGRPTSGLPPGAMERGVARSVEAAGRRLERAAAPGTGTDARPRPGGTSVRRLGGMGRGTHPDGRIRGGTNGARMGGTARRTGTGDLPGQGRSESSLPAAVESEGEHGARSRVAQGMHGRALPQGARGSSGPGHDDAELQRPASHLVPLGGGGSGTKGIAAHFGLATSRRPLGVFEIDATMRDDKDESESVRWPLRQGAGNRARLPRHAGHHRVRPGRGWNCCRGRSRRVPAWWCAPAARSGGACCAKMAAKKGFGTTWRNSRC